MWQEQDVQNWRILDLRLHYITTLFNVLAAFMMISHSFWSSGRLFKMHSVFRFQPISHLNRNYILVSEDFTRIREAALYHWHCVLQLMQLGSFNTHIHTHTCIQLHMFAFKAFPSPGSCANCCSFCLLQTFQFIMQGSISYYFISNLTKYESVADNIWLLS